MKIEEIWAKYTKNRLDVDEIQKAKPSRTEIEGIAGAFTKANALFTYIKSQIPEVDYVVLRSNGFPGQNSAIRLSVWLKDVDVRLDMEFSSQELEDADSLMVEDHFIRGCVLQIKAKVKQCLLESSSQKLQAL